MRPLRLRQLSRFQAALYAGTAIPSLSANLRGLYAGDSTFAGVQSPTGGGTAIITNMRPNSVPSRVAYNFALVGFNVALQTINGDNANGITQAAWNDYRPEITIGTAATFGGTVDGNAGLGTTLSAGTQSPTAGGVNPIMGASTNGLDILLNNSADVIDFWLDHVSGTGSLLVKKNGVTISTINNATGNPAITRHTLTGLTLNSGDTVSFSRSGGNAYLPFAIDIYDSTKKAWHIFNAGMRNSTISSQATNDWMLTTFLNSPRSTFGGMGTFYDYVVFCLGINDQRQSSRSSATCEANIKLLVGDILAVNPNCKLVFATPHPTGSEVSWTNATMSTIYQDLANFYNGLTPGSAAWVDTAGLCATKLGSGTYAGLNAAGYMAADGLHTSTGVSGDGGIDKVQADGIAIALRTLFGV